MKKKKLAAEAVAPEAVEVTATEKPAKKQKSSRGGFRDLHSLFFVIGIVLGVASILFTIIAKNGINNEKLYFTMKLFGAKKETEFKFLTSSLTSMIAGGLAVLSIAFGVTRNILKRQNTLISYLIGVVALVLSGLAMLAIRYP
ncbi:MAG: hypothetical protein J1E00_08630 [Oscillospiraceae bacterium]|nr:hypothetical protein [Oscillospiraceae bacterium]